MAATSSGGTIKPQNLEASVIAAAQGLINVLQQNIQQSNTPPVLQSSVPTNEQRDGRAQAPKPAVLEEMSRSFPGFYVKRKGKKHFSPLQLAPGKAKTCKPFIVYVYLVNRGCTSTPSATEELELTQAGLGKRSLTLADDMNHTMVNDIINEEYPKMEGVDGWLLYKSTGGPGKRKLIAIPPDVDGYTGRFIRSVSSAGKTLLYIAPLQNDLDLTPLPSDAAEFKKMPRAACQVCKKTMPLHILALHIEGCTETQSTSDEEGEFRVMSVTNSSPVNLYKSSSDLIDLTQDIKECPICLCCFPASEIAQHASLCGERFEDGGCLHWRTDSGPRIDPENKMIDEEEDERSLADLSSESDVLQWLASQVDKSKDFKICITRDDLVQRGFIQWQRQKKGSPLNKLNVTFIGEAGIDTGALSKEFLTEMMHGIERILFEGSGKKRKSPIYSISDLENGYYRTAGEVFSVSLDQGGPPPHFLRNWCYQFLASGDFDSLKVNKDDVDDLEYALLIERVEAASDVTELTEEIVSCGYTGLLTSDRKDSIIRAIVLHATMQLTPMLQQIRNGMKVYNLVELIRRHQNLCSELFVPKEDDDTPDTDYIMAILIPELSERGSQRHARENAIINFLQDFLQDLEIPDQEEAEEVCGPMPQELQAEDQGGHWSQNQPSRMSVPTVMQWLTGQRHKPLLPSERADFKINVRFDHLCKEKNPGHHICYPLVSACTNTVTFPVAHMNTYTEFRDVITTAIRMGGAFGRI